MMYFNRVSEICADTLFGFVIFHEKQGVVRLVSTKNIPANT